MTINQITDEINTVLEHLDEVEHGDLERIAAIRQKVECAQEELYDFQDEFGDSADDEADDNFGEDEFR